MGGALRRGRDALAAAGRRLLLLVVLDSIGPAGPPRAEIGRRIARKEKEEEKK